jgi:hypothetical protein
VGVYHWNDFPGHGDFYPEDLPREWRLSYYANEFNSACVDISALVRIPKLLMELTEDLHERFELSLFLDSETQFELLSELRQQEVRISYFMVESEAIRQALIRYLGDSARSLEGFADVQQIIAIHQCWAPQAQHRSSSIALLPGDASPRQLREWIERWTSFDDGLPSRSLTLWLDARSTGYEDLTACRTLVELMGF